MPIFSFPVFWVGRIKTEISLAFNHTLSSPMMLLDPAPILLEELCQARSDKIKTPNFKREVMATKLPEVSGKVSTKAHA